MITRFAHLSLVAVALTACAYGDDTCLDIAGPNVEVATDSGARDPHGRLSVEEEEDDEVELAESDCGANESSHDGTGQSNKSVEDGTGRSSQSVDEGTGGGVRAMASEDAADNDVY